MRPFPALDFILRGEPEMTLRELLDTLEGRTPSNPAVQRMLAGTRSAPLSSFSRTTANGAEIGRAHV